MFRLLVEIFAIFMKWIKQANKSDILLFNRSYEKYNDKAMPDMYLR